MRLASTLAAALLIGSASLIGSAPAMSAPLGVQTNLSSIVPSATENVQFRRYGYGRGGYGYGRRGYGYGRRGYGGGGALIGGLAAGAIIGGAIAAGSAANAASNNNVAYCSQRYRSYDPASGTYLNNDGNRYPCP